jgi:hypothetical protein
MIYLLAISTQRNLDLTHGLDPQLEQVVRRCLAGRSHTASQELAAIRIKEGIESVVFLWLRARGRMWPCTWKMPKEAPSSYAIGLRIWTNSVSVRLYECGRFSETNLLYEAGQDESLTGGSRRWRHTYTQGPRCEWHGPDRGSTPPCSSQERSKVGRTVVRRSAFRTTA